jgi:Putative addiction module component
VNARIHHLLDEMLALEQSERSALLFALLDSHEAKDPSVEVLEAWKQLAQERLGSLDRGETVAVPWEEAKARFLAL